MGSTAHADVAVLESGLFTLDTRWGFSAGNATSTLFILNTRLSGSSTSASSDIFTLDTQGAVVATATVSGRVFSGSSGLPNATVSVLQANRTLASTSTDGTGNYALPALPPGAYEFRAVKADYLTDLRLNVALVSNQALSMDFSLSPRPPPPVTQAASRIPVATQAPPVRSVTATQLKLFSGGQFITGGTLDPSKMTVVMTHGWNSNPDAWAKGLAQAMADNGVGANLCAWDWSEEAGTGSLLGLAVSRIPRQAETLAQALSDALGSSYNQPLHLLGHSLGTLVNGMTADILHGDSRAKPGSQIFNPLKTHLTLFDDAELTEGFVMDEAFDQRYTPVPARSAWVDNYFTLTGRFRVNAVNAYLGRGNTLWPHAPLLAHSYPSQWYQLTVSDPVSSTLGFRFSFERLGGNAFFPTPSPFAYGTLLKQDPSLFADELSLIVPVTPGEVTGLIAKNLRGRVRQSYQSAVSATQNAIQFAGNVAASISEKLFGSDDASPAWSLRLDLQTGPASAGGAARLAAQMTPEANVPAYAWLPLAVPTNVATFVFDFVLAGDGSNDVLVAGINGTNVFAQEARLIPHGVTVSSTPIDVVSFAGQTVELFIGIIGGSSTNMTIAVDGIRFYEPFRPTLQVARSGNAAVIAWPVSAEGFVLENTAMLSDSSNWATVTNNTVVEDFEFVITNSVSGGTRFFRLRKP
jgi:pimeloyl-ACP methyl ester carboxylesterase